MAMPSAIHHSSSIRSAAELESAEAADRLGVACSGTSTMANLVSTAPSLMSASRRQHHCCAVAATAASGWSMSAPAVEPRTTWDNKR